MTLLKEVIIIGGKKLSACGENYTTANDDTVTISSMGIRDRDREMKLSNEQLREQKRKVPRGEQVGLIWPHGEKVPAAVEGCRLKCPSETPAMRNTPQTSIHQLLVLLDHLYL